MVFQRLGTKRKFSGMIQLHDGKTMLKKFLILVNLLAMNNLWFMVLAQNLHIFFQFPLVDLEFQLWASHV